MNPPCSKDDIRGVSPCPEATLPLCNDVEIAPNVSAETVSSSCARVYNGGNVYNTCFKLEMSQTTTSALRLR